MASDFWFKFYFKKWADDVKPLSLTARGLLVELVIYMRRPEVKGRVVNDTRLLCRLTGGLTDEVTGSLTEFKTHKTLDFEIGGDGLEYLVSRSITEEFKVSAINAANGSKGGNPNLKPVNLPLNPKDKRTPKRLPYFDFDFDFNTVFKNKSETEIKEVFEKEFKLFFGKVPMWMMPALRVWLPYKRQRGRGYKQIGFQALLAKWDKDFKTEQELLEAATYSAGQGWQGIFKEKINEHGNGNTKTGTDKNSESRSKVVQQSISILQGNQHKNGG